MVCEKSMVEPFARPTPGADGSKHSGATTGASTGGALSSPVVEWLNKGVMSVLRSPDCGPFVTALTSSGSRVEGEGCQNQGLNPRPLYNLVPAGELLDPADEGIRDKHAASGDVSRGGGLHARGTKVRS
eukprot:973429-Prorocentrum_minimum.AAC.1